MSLSEILTNGFRLTNRYWQLVFIHLGGVFLLFIILFFSFLIPLVAGGYQNLLRDFEWGDLLETRFEEFSIEDFATLLLIFLPSLFLGITLSLCLYIFLSGGVKGIYKDDLLQVGVQSALGGEPLRFSFSRFIQNGKVYFWRIAGIWTLLGLLLLPLLLFFGLYIGGIVWMFKEEKVGEALLILFSLGFLLLLLSFFFTLFAHFSNIILVMENRGAGSALREGFRFLKSHFGSSAGLYILLVLIQLGIGFAFSIFQFPFSFIPILGTLIYLFLLPLQTLLSIYLTLFLTATLMVFYKDRTRGETVEFQL